MHGPASTNRTEPLNHMPQSKRVRAAQDSAQDHGSLRSLRVKRCPWLLKGCRWISYKKKKQKKQGVKTFFCKAWFSLLTILNGFTIIQVYFSFYLWFIILLCTLWLAHKWKNIINNMMLLRFQHPKRNERLSMTTTTWFTKSQSHRSYFSLPVVH